MFARFVQISFVISMISIGCLSAFAQNGADNRPVFGDEKDFPVVRRETRVRMRIEQEKKDYDEMLKRGEEVRRISERLARSFELRGSLSDDDRNQLESLEKNVKKIREELGGNDDDEKIEEVLGGEKTPSLANAIDKLKTTSTDLVDELKKTTRFSISATAIQSSNNVLTVARFLRVWK